jgi:hypothetical protein
LKRSVEIGELKKELNKYIELRWRALAEKRMAEVEAEERRVYIDLT